VNLRFPQQCSQRSKFFGIYHCIEQQKVTDISEELTASILLSKQSKKKSRFTIKIGYITHTTINGVGSQWEWQCYAMRRDTEGTSREEKGS